MGDSTDMNLQILDDLVRRLRAPDGCPWDREQDFDDLRAYLLEEAHEVAAALDQRDWEGLCGEIGDLLFQLAFLGRLSEEQGRSGLAESISRVQQKMIDRHPHVFGDADAADAAAVAQAWERRKLDARAPGSSILEGMSDSLPSLLAAYRMGQKVGGVGFDWSTAAEVVAKVDEEMAELREAMDQSKDRVADEIGDLLFTVANLARHLQVDPEAALARANLRFRTRFNTIERRLEERGERLTEASREDLEGLWEQAKREETAEPRSGS